MKLYKTFLIIFGIAILPLIVNAETPEENAKRAKEILEKALKQWEELSFKSETKEKFKYGVIINKYFKKESLDGTRMTRRETLYEINKEYDKKYKAENTISINNGSHWDLNLVKKTAVKRAYLDKVLKKNTHRHHEHKEPDDSIFSVREIIFNEMKCYEVKLDIPNSKNIEVYIIKIDDLLIYSKQKFSRKGVKVLDRTYSNIIVEELPNSLFEIPKDFKVVIYNDVLDSLELKKENYIKDHKLTGEKKQKFEERFDKKMKQYKNTRSEK